MGLRTPAVSFGPAAVAGGADEVRTQAIESGPRYPGLCVAEGVLSAYMSRYEGSGPFKIPFSRTTIDQRLAGLALSLRGACFCWRCTSFAQVKRFFANVNLSQSECCGTYRSSRHHSGLTNSFRSYRLYRSHPRRGNCTPQLVALLPLSSQYSRHVA